MKRICGEVMEIFCDKNIDRLNLELIIKGGIPCIVFEDLTGNKDLITLHIKEAIALKSMIDNLVLSYLENKNDDV